MGNLNKNILIIVEPTIINTSRKKIIQTALEDNCLKSFYINQQDLVKKYLVLRK